MADSEKPTADGTAVEAKPDDDYIKPVPKPDDQQFRLDIEKTQKELSTLQRQLKSVQEKISEKRNGSQELQKKVAAERKKLAPMQKRRNALRAERKKLYDKKDSLTEGIDRKKAHAQKLKDNLRFTNLNAINDEIRKLEFDLTSQSYALLQEKAMVKQIEKLKMDKKGVQRYADASKAAKASEGAVKELRAQIREASQRLGVAEKDLDKNSGVIRELQKSLSSGKNLSPLFKEQNDIRDNITKKRSVLTQLNKDLRELTKAYDIYSAKMRKKKYAAGKADRDKYRLEMEQKRKEHEDELAKQKPWMAEIGACDSMVEYLQSMLPKDSPHAERRMDGENAFTREEFQAFYGGLLEWAKAPQAPKAGEAVAGATITLPDGTVITPMVGKGGKDAIMVGGDRHKRKRNRKKKKVMRVRHTPDTLYTFNLLKLSPPQSVDDIPAALEELQKKRDYYDTLPRAVKKAPQKKTAKAAAKGGEKKAAVAPPVAPKEVELLTAGKEYNMYITYSDDKAVGQPAPLLEGLEVCQPGTLNAIPTYQKGKTTVVYFWARFIKDNAYGPLCGLDELDKKYDALQVVAIGIDPAKADVLKHIKKATKYGTIAGNKEWTGGKTDLTLAWEDSTPANGGPKVKQAFHKLTGMDSFMCPQAFIVDQNGIIAWRQAFSRNTTPWATSRFTQQLSAIMGGKSLYSFGPNPSPQDDDSELEGYGSNDEAEDVFANAEPAADGAW